MHKKLLKYFIIPAVFFSVFLFAGCPDGAFWPFDDTVQPGDGREQDDPADTGDAGDTEDPLDLDAVPLIEVSSVETLSPYSLKVNWPAVEGVDLYAVYRCFGSGYGVFDLVDGAVSGNSYTDTGLLYDSFYYYKVVAVVSDDPADAAYLLSRPGTLDWGGRTEDVEEFSFDTAPTNLRNTDLYYDSLSLAWDAAEGAEYYRVAVQLEPEGEYGYIETLVEGTEFTWDAADVVLPDTLYTFKVAAVKMVEYEGELVEGRSALSEALAVTTLRRDLTLSVASTSCGSVTAPGEGDFVLVRDEAEALAALPDSGMEFEGWTASSATIADASSAVTNVILSSGDGAVEAHFYDPDNLLALTDARLDTGGLTDADDDGYFCGGTAVLEYKIAAPKTGDSDYFLKIFALWMDDRLGPQKELLDTSAIKSHRETGMTYLSYLSESFSVPPVFEHGPINIVVEVWRPERLNRDSTASLSDGFDFELLVETPTEDGSGGGTFPVIGK